MSSCGAWEIRPSAPLLMYTLATGPDLLLCVLGFTVTVPVTCTCTAVCLNVIRGPNYGVFSHAGAVFIFGGRLSYSNW